MGFDRPDHDRFEVVTFLLGATGTASRSGRARVSGRDCDQRKNGASLRAGATWQALLGGRAVRTCVDAPLDASRTSGRALRGIGYCLVVRPLMRRITCRGPVWKYGGQVHIIETRSKRYPNGWFSRPRLTDVAPYLSLDLLTPSGCLASVPHKRWRPELGRSRPSSKGPTQCVRSCLATATMTSIGGLRASIRPSHSGRATHRHPAPRRRGLAHGARPARARRPAADLPAVLHARTAAYRASLAARRRAHRRPTLRLLGPYPRTNLATMPRSRSRSRHPTPKQPLPLVATAIQTKNVITGSVLRAAADDAVRSVRSQPQPRRPDEPAPTGGRGASAQTGGCRVSTLVH